MFQLPASCRLQNKDRHAEYDMIVQEDQHLVYHRAKQGHKKLCLHSDLHPRKKTELRRIVFHSHTESIGNRT